MAEKEGFWEQSKKDMQDKMSLFNEVWDELGLPVTTPPPVQWGKVLTCKVHQP